MSDELQKAHQQSDRFARTATRAIRILGIGLVLALGVGFAGVWHDRGDSRHNRQLIDEINAGRKARNLGLCIQTNVEIQGVRNALIGGVDGLLAISTQFTPEQIRTIHDTYKASVDAELPFRDCSPTGIQMYLEHPPADPATK